MIQGKPKWWKVILKDPGSWLVILTVVAIILSSITVQIFETLEESKTEQPDRVTLPGTENGF